MNNQALILDTETASLNGLPIQISFMPCEFSQGGELAFDLFAIFDEYFTVDEKICFASMAVHHIVESDLIGKPSYKTFRLPEDTVYLIGHNIKYDVEAISKCGIDVSKIKPICTLALARMVYPEAPAHNISALSYFLTQNVEGTRQVLKNAHDAKTDIQLTLNILRDIVFKKNITSMAQLFNLSEEAKIPTHINFGKHRGTAISELPLDYVQWLMRQEDLDPYVRQALIKHRGGC